MDLQNIPQMLSVKETAENFGISQYYARQLALSGTVKAVRIGKGKILINAASVAEYFETSRISDQTENTASPCGITPIPAKI